MKFLEMFALLVRARTTIKPHNDMLRAGQYPDVAFSPWRIFVS
jgi:hypothetical protein